MTDFRVGQGFDVHRLVPERKLILCGVEIPCEYGLLGHSDADVAVHALMDAPNATLSYEEAAAGQDMSGYEHMWDYVRRAHFTTDHFLFVQTDSGAAGAFVEMDPSYGVLPNPKLTEDQDNYYHLVDQYSCAWAIPSDNDEIEKTDILFTAWNYLSDNALEAYYEKTLKHKRMDSPDDAEMLDIIRTNTRYEISLILDFGVASVVTSAYRSGNLASSYARKQKAIERMITTKFESLID